MHLLCRAISLFFGTLLKGVSLFLLSQFWEDRFIYKYAFNNIAIKQ